MALTAKLELRQGQQLVMTPQLQQAIKLLQLSNLELEQYVDGELERNPLLEREEGASGDANGESPGSDGDQVNGASLDDDWLDLDKPRSDPDGTFDTDLDNVYPDASAADVSQDMFGSGWAGLKGRGPGSMSDDDANIEAFVSSSISLKDHLSQQLPLALTEPAHRIIGQYLIDLVDDAGYLNADLDELSEKLGAPESMVEEVLEALQKFDPPGVFARSLGECLELQLKELNRYDPQIAALLDNLGLVATHDFAKLKRVVGVDMDELTDMITEIKGLNPKPGLMFGSVQVQPVVPDVLVRSAADGSWLVELNSDTLPRVLVNRSYYARVAKAASTGDDKEYLSDCLQTANWLVKSLDQRARTILKVAQEIVRQQDGFFTYGVQYLRPLNLKTVAEAISMHESTVSRVTSNKYMATSRGIFELKYFFTSSISAADDGEAHSSEAVRFRIKQLIDGETSNLILSDDKIVDLLRSDGIDIARRTVAKYREAMRIPSSVQRRREKRLSGVTARAT
ncbi:RNA polymerase sigma-54 factor 2 [Candidatus Filomicrobium marinum]|uniref:RNA polymerase sigma-54 factor n=2 Tax=Filomicrobium TaxID=119044 RepID=A0A0D6JEY3_9HYPH|nr:MULTISPECIES: RNA polymerase factor sigma-54 [Filomicrobium]CFX17601.1 RNA polymerase sigma-54 factor 2 [Candidatus Filomicrobium marinum]CPR18268.1 RNA polymerase sigma-54 factor 2 [Candidatus Filomicrobium marinum]SDO21453.1 RNA polymerase, sigma 54 subunit, RpoN/SigL [Filomicrobium insigne]